MIRFYCSRYSKTINKNNLARLFNSKPEDGDKNDSKFSGSFSPKNYEARDTPINSNKKYYENYQNAFSESIKVASQNYEQIERNLMNSIRESNQRRFRIILSSIIIGTIWIIGVFGENLRKSFTDHTAGLAKEALENESLKIQTQELATAVVQTILENSEITSRSAVFLKNAATTNETQQVLLKLAIHVLQHPDTQLETIELLKKVINQIIADKVFFINLLLY
jgi:hypothetical protein